MTGSSHETGVLTGSGRGALRGWRMGRGVLAGGLLICASVVAAVVLNRSAREDAAPAAAEVQISPRCAPHAEPAGGAEKNDCPRVREPVGGSGPVPVEARP